MTVSDSSAFLDENEDWPTHGTYKYTPYYSSREQVHVYEDATTRAQLEKMVFDYVVIGAGPIGAALAYSLAADNPLAQVLVVEKSWNEPDRIVGELMQPSGCQALGELGLANVFSDIGAVPVHGYYLSYKGKHTYIPYLDRPHRSSGGSDGAQRRYRGVSFHHGRLVMNLRAACKALSNVYCVEGSVTELLLQSDSTADLVTGVRIGPSRSTPETETHTTPVCPRILTLVCDGITSQFRKVLNDTPIALLSHFCGFVLEHDAVESGTFFGSAAAAGAMAACSAPTDCSDNPLPMPHNGNVLLDGAGPVLLYQMSERETRVLADIPGPSLPSEAGGHLRAVLRASLAAAAPKHMYPALHAHLMAKVESAQRIRCIGSKFIPATDNRIGGALWIGDALNVRHPLTGGGMTIGLWDVVHVTRLLKQQQQALSTAAAEQRRRIVRRAVAEWQWRRRGHALVVNVLSVALHALFAAETKELGLLREACFAYLARGGACTMDPSGFLSGLLASPLLLIYHFFSVAVLAVWMRVSGASTAYTGGSVLFRVYSAMYTLYVAAGVLLPLIWQELRP
ncbi:Squalene epoxidase [Coemansia sp. RSA 1933]|nr:Squalene epoxidase [Coemansia sp. RSA 1933]